MTAQGISVLKSLHACPSDLEGDFWSIRLDRMSNSGDNLLLNTRLVNIEHVLCSVVILLDCEICLMIGMGRQSLIGEGTC